MKKHHDGLRLLGGCESASCGKKCHAKIFAQNQENEQ